LVYPVRAGYEPWPVSVEVSQDTVSPHFPESIQFDFKVKFSGDAPRFNKVELSYQLIGEVATKVRPINFSRDIGQEISASFQADTQKDYIPPGTRLNYFWTLYDETGKVYNTAAKEFTYLDTRFKFQELKSGIVTVRWYQGDANFGQTILNKASATIEKLNKLYSLTPKNPINITVYPDSRTLFTALPPNTAEWVGGQATPTLGTILLSLAPDNQAEIGRSVPHEISHQVVYQATRNPYNMLPTWLDEGLAVQSQDQVEGFLLEAFERAIDKHTLYPLRTLNSSFPTDTQQSYLAYAESVKVVQYILDKYGQAAMGKLLDAFREGVTYDEAFQRGLGINLDDLDQKWKQSIGYSVLALSPTSAAPSPTFTSLPVSPSVAAGSSVHASPEKLSWLAVAGTLLLIGGGCGLTIFFLRRSRY
jgi:hypothetical protein